jgi:Tfp pilus assembly protein PilV
MLKAFFKRIKSQKGMSGVLVALLLVVVGVGLVAGINTFLNNNKTEIQKQAQASLKKAGVDNAVAE